MQSAPRPRSLAGAAMLAGLAFTLGASADQYQLVIRDHRFEPATLEVPAGQEVSLLVKNMDATPEEFESHDLDREKVIAGGQEAVIRIGRLAPGSYEFVGEFHEDTAKGRIVVK